MNFTSRAFLIFLPIVLAVYHLLPTRTTKFRFLLAASWLFYMSWNPWFLWVIVATSIVDYLAGIGIEDAASPGRRRAWLIFGVVVNLGFLATFKYTDFVGQSATELLQALGWPAPDWTARMILPLGISFHTFQGIGYTLDVHRGRIQAVRSFADFALFVSFFPQLVAGPIVRATEFLPQMVSPPPVRTRQIAEGLHWFLLGMCKKLVFADRLAEFVDPIFAHPELYDAFTLRWAVVAYAAQIYCDFSGYSDLAIGMAKWFGFELPINFNYPYLAGSIAEFWRRWHVTLGRWMRDYLYVALGGSRHGSFRTAFNLLLIMMLSGLWHGASWNYVAWGLYNGVLLVVHRVWDQALTGRAWADAIRSSALYRATAIATTFWLFCVGMIWLHAHDWAGCYRLQAAFLGFHPDGARYLPAWVPLLVALVAAGHLASGLRNLRCSLLYLPAPARAAAYVVLVVLVVVCSPIQTKPFVYFQF
jgi:alginate O-acetyltransferase complex protein AlgI